jgi:enamine deaminase RidA (YjgF/YER057c/UK114 family)
VPGLIFCSGQIPAREDGSLVSGVPEGCTQCISNLKKVLESKGSSIDQIVKVNIYLKDLANFDTMNKAYEASVVLLIWKVWLIAKQRHSGTPTGSHLHSGS